MKMQKPSETSYQSVRNKACGINSCITYALHLEYVGNLADEGFMCNPELK